ncbi:MAG: phosphoribosylglycinamide formyltransferase [Candidatus Babeliales bacterium]
MYLRFIVVFFLFFYHSFFPFLCEKNKEPLNIAILVSGQGSNMEAILHYFKQPKKQGLIKPCVVVSNKKNAYALERAKKNFVPTVYLPSKIKNGITNEKKSITRKQYAQKLIACLEEHGVTPKNGLICAAGFMVIIHKDFLNHFPNQVINIHPALLPSFPGNNGIKGAFAYGVKVTGVTVHFVDEGIDTGPIIAQKVVPIANDETLATLKEKIHKAEHELYPRVIEQIVYGNMKMVDKTKIDNSSQFMKIKSKM